jgi:acetylornithine deacetylase/succinyl-diaminopimelate desuccinylase-like protein
MARDWIAGTLEDLVAVESTPDAGGKAILDATASVLGSLGLRPRVDRRLGTVTAAHGRGGVLFNGHLDTVPLGSGWRVRPGTWRGGRLYGRGTADMKAGCVAAMAAGQVLLRKDVPFSLLFTTDEETTMRAAKALQASRRIREAAAVVVGEPSRLAPFTAEKGVYWFDAVATGRAAHGSLPHLGENAILKLRPLLDRVAGHARPREVMQELTINVGRIQGGTKTNVVADTATAELDVRYPPRMRPGQVRARLRRLAGKEVRLVERHHVPAAAVDPRARHIRLLSTLARRPPGAVTYATEMAWYARHNPRSVVFGPGEPEQCHVPDEFVDVRDVRRGAEVYAAFATALVSE